MKTKKPRAHPLAKILFNVGMTEWIRVEPKKPRGDFDKFEPGQIKAWNAIARYVAKMKRL